VASRRRRCDNVPRAWTLGEGMTHKTRWTPAALLASALVVSCWVSAATPVSLLHGLIQTPLESHPNGITPLIAPFDPGGDAKALGLLGAVRISFPGSDPRAQISYYVFANSGDAITYSNRHLALPPHAGKLIPYPPFAQCDDIAGGGYCEMVVQDLSVDIVTKTSAPMDKGAIPMMGLAFRHLFAVAKASETPPAPPVVGGLAPCRLVDAAEVSAALGSPVGAPQPDLVGGCSWMSAHGGITVQPKQGGRSQFEFDRSRMSGAQSIAGIGDAAFALHSLAGFVQINILKGNRYVVVTVQPQGIDAMAAAEQLARKIAARM